MSLTPEARPRFPTATLVLGAVAVLISLSHLGHMLFEWQFSPYLGFILLLALAGAALIVSGLNSARRAKKLQSPANNSSDSPNQGE